MRKKLKEENTDKWKDIPCLWIRIINIVKIFQVIPQNNLQSSICVKIPITAFFTDF